MEMPTFLYLLRSRRERFMETITEEEDRILGLHFDYLKGHCDRGTLVLAGPCLDAAFGVVVFHAASEDEARVVMDNDPAIVHGVMGGELHPFRVSLLAHR